MARRKLKIMISSRCNDRFPAEGGRGSKTLSEIRKQLKAEIEAEKIFGKEAFEVWINEDEPAEPATQGSWELCISKVREADLVLVLYNGDAGWSVSPGHNGICHAEMMTAYSESPGKLALISLMDKKAIRAGLEHQRFQDEVERLNLFRGSTISSPEDVIKEAKKAVRELLLNIAHLGARETKQSKYNIGPALEWSRMDFAARQAAMRDVLVTSLSARGLAKGDGVVLAISGHKVLFVPAAIPGAVTVPAAREMVGQPFLRDHTFAKLLKGNIAGPVHIIACQKSVTESQAMALLGFPDATIVKGSFGVYVADNVQKIQLCLIANCRDDASTRHGLQKLFDWLSQSGEDKLLAIRATSRARIVAVVANESA